MKRGRTEQMEADTSRDSEQIENDDSIGMVKTLMPRTYHKINITIRRRNMLTINGYKVNDGGDSYAVSLLPTNFLDWWVQKTTGKWEDPLGKLSELDLFPYMRFNSAEFKISHFIPLQSSLTGTAQVDTTTFNIAPYLFIAEEDMGIINTLQPLNLSESSMLAQDIKIPSNSFWKNQNDEGLLACNRIHTMGAGQTFIKKYDFPVNSHYFFRTPQYKTDTLTYMPYSQEIDTGSVNPIILKGTYGSLSETGTFNPIFLFLPYIEPISVGENVPRLMCSVLLESSISLTLFSQPDSFTQFPINREVAAKINSIPLKTTNYKTIKTIIYGNRQLQ